MQILSLLIASGTLITMLFKLFNVVTQLQKDILKLQLKIDNIEILINQKIENAILKHNYKQ